ncbi:competence type IV pilus major pilin ComGC [Dehalobacterium formicoaceticum]|uniref:competence type IV pilus major pilin ComGC n=1 Tax=Dehalobacterium formicoaceticum TaxID=51515 RepID=UPI0023EE6DD3|nr:prepilin-type N-terminal cleavage/methylation domain-containing protein [Dehalobacterium formicoaceticum]
MLQKIRDLIKSDKGFTLIELVVVIVILGILAAIAIPRFTDRRGEAEEAAIQADIKILQNAVDMYYFDEAAFPSNLDEANLVTPGYLKSIPQSVTDGEINYDSSDGDVTPAP